MTLPAGDESASSQSRALERHWRCTACAYDLFGLVGDPICCPECGEENSLSTLEQLNCLHSEREYPSYVIAATSGIIIWIGVALSGDCVEAWDCRYFPIGIILSSVVAGALGTTRPRHCWRWGIVIGFTQGLTHVAMTLGRSLGPTWPLGLCLLTVLCGLYVGCAYGGAHLSRKTHDKWE